MTKDTLNTGKRLLSHTWTTVFSGKSTIEFEYNTDSSYIVLLAGSNDGFTVTGVTLSGGIEVVEWEHFKEKELLIVQKKNAHEIGKSYTLEIEFESYLNKRATGFYESSYLDEVNSLVSQNFHMLNCNVTCYTALQNGERHYLATTQFQHSSCRKAFPSFDDPGLKQTFSFDCEYLFSFLINK